jgi:transcriptional regulator with XRE-family HTH domain
MTRTVIDLGGDLVVRAVAATIRSSRRVAGWTQRELAARSGTSQATICRLESGLGPTLDLVIAERVLTALGLRPSLVLDDRHLDDRRRQLDGLHARIGGFVARRLERDAWLTASEVEVGEGAPRGWIDLLAYRPADRSLVVEETKADLPDMGGLQRSVAFYQREAWAAARRLGWRPIRSTVLVVALDSEAIARRLADNRDLVTRAFPAPIPGVAAWLRDPGREAPRGWAIGTCDPASRESAWLRPTTLGSRRRPPAYEDYAHAAALLLRS